MKFLGRARCAMMGRRANLLMPMVFGWFPPNTTTGSGTNGITFLFTFYLPAAITKIATAEVCAARKAPYERPVGTYRSWLRAASIKEVANWTTAPASKRAPVAAGVCGRCSHSPLRSHFFFPIAEAHESARDVPCKVAIVPNGPTCARRQHSPGLKARGPAAIVTA